MADEKPPRRAAGERETLLALLQYQRDSFVRKLTGISDADARREFVASGTTLLWLMKHMARAEDLWIEQRFAGQEPEILDDTVRPGDSVDAASRRTVPPGRASTAWSRPRRWTMHAATSATRRS